MKKPPALPDKGGRWEGLVGRSLDEEGFNNDV